MGLQDQAFENCEKWMHAYKGWESNLDKCLFPLNTLLMTELPSSFHKIGKCLLSPGFSSRSFNFSYV